MNKVGLTFGQQIVPITSDTPISEHEKADLVEMKKVLDQKIGKDVVNFRLKDDKNMEIIVNDPNNPKREEYIANQLRKMSEAIHPKKPVTSPSVDTQNTAQPGQNLNVVA